MNLFYIESKSKTKKSCFFSGFFFWGGDGAGVSGFFYYESKLIGGGEVGVGGERAGARVSKFF